VAKSGTRSILIRHASGDSLEKVAESVQRYKDQGYRYVRAQMAVPGTSTYGASGGRRDDHAVLSNQRTEVWEPAAYVRLVPRLFEYLRKTVGEEVELLHDIHERVPPILAIQMAKDLEPYRLFFLEDPFAPEDIGYFRHLRNQTSTPIAMGELFNNPNEWLPLVSERLIDFIRVHISQVGGVTMARKMAAACASFSGYGRRGTGRGTSRPVGHAATFIWIWSFQISASRRRVSSIRPSRTYSRAARY
jgi:mannonate dehydratase